MSGESTAARSAPPRSEAELDDRLSEPAPGVLATLEAIPGDVVVVGAGGKMGPTMARMLRRGADALSDRRRIIAVSRFAAAARPLEEADVEVVRADLTDFDAVASLPDAPNAILMVGHKFGTTAAPGMTWLTNAVIPALVARRYRASRIVAFSTGNVYPLVPAGSGGAREGDEPTPVGEYAWSALARERILALLSEAQRTPMAIIRLNYAVDLRYGVLVDIAQRVRDGQPVDLSMGRVNVIWQGDAVAQAIEALRHANVPPLVVNVTGPELLRVRDVAEAFGHRFGRSPVFSGHEGTDALLSDTALARRLFGAPRVSAATLIEWVGDWIERGGRTLGKPTGFEQREGRF